MRLDNKIINEIIKDYSEGNLNKKDISKKYNVSQDTVAYHINSEYKKNKIEREKERFRKLDTKQRSILYTKKREYAKNYRKNRYHNDPVFRKKIIQRNIDYKKNKRLQEKDD